MNKFFLLRESYFGSDTKGKFSTFFLGVRKSNSGLATLLLYAIFLEEKDLLFSMVTPESPILLTSCHRCRLTGYYWSCC